MSIETDINDALKAYAGLTALVGTQIYLGPLPPSVTFPAIRYNWITHQPTHNLKGRDSLARTVFQYDIWATTSASIRDIRAQLIAAIESASAFESILLDVQAEMPENDQELRRLSLDYSHWHTF